MKILHTSDWHIGKRLGRHDRMGEFADVLAEVETIADEREVDLVLVSGDVWDRPIAADGRARPRPADACCASPSDGPWSPWRATTIPPDLFEALAPLLRPGACT